MAAKSKFDFPLAYVLWEDAYSQDDWVPLNEAKTYTPCHIKSVGWLVDESEKHITIIQSVGDNEACSRIVIPKPYIRLFQTLVGNGKWKTSINHEDTTLSE